MGLDLIYEPGQTPLDDDEKEDLIIPTITTQRELNEAEQLNIQDAIEWALYRRRIKSETILTEEFICRAHQKMYGDVWRWAGEFRKTNKNIGIDKRQIPVALRQLIDDCSYWIDHKTFPEDEIAIQFKHRIVSIHCFPNGNGRHSRLMADIMMRHIFGKAPFNWSGGDLQGEGAKRKDYLVALREVDQGRTNMLLEFAKS